MATAINKTTLEFRRSVGAGYDEPDWKRNPDMSRVIGVDRRYWKWDAANQWPDEMTQTEKDAVDLAADTAAKDSSVAFLDTVGYDAMRALVLILIDEINILRATQSLPDRTVAQFKSAMQEKM